MTGYSILGQENEVVPDPTGWFPATIVIHFPGEKAYVNNSGEPLLAVEQLSSRKQGVAGSWVGNGSEGRSRNLRIMPED